MFDRFFFHSFKRSLISFLRRRHLAYLSASSCSSSAASLLLCPAPPPSSFPRTFPSHSPPLTFAPSSSVASTTLSVPGFSSDHPIPLLLAPPAAASSSAFNTDSHSGVAVSSSSSSSILSIVPTSSSVSPLPSHSPTSSHSPRCAEAGNGNSVVEKKKCDDDLSPSAAEQARRNALIIGWRGQTQGENLP